MVPTRDHIDGNKVKPFLFLDPTMSYLKPFFNYFLLDFIFHCNFNVVLSSKIFIHTYIQ